jgi:hypothetical protein
MDSTKATSCNIPSILMTSNSSLADVFPIVTYGSVSLVLQYCDLGLPGRQ